MGRTLTPLIPVTYAKLDAPVRTRTKVLSRTSFMQLLAEELPDMEIVRKYGISRNMWITSKVAYADEFAEQLAARTHANYSRSMRRRPKRFKSVPAIVVDKSRLEHLLAEGRTLPRIAQALAVSEFTLARNLSFHGLAEPSARLPARMQTADLHLLETLEQFSPGIVDKVKAYYRDPHAFYGAMYEAFCRLNELIWFVQDHAKGHSSYRESERIPKDHICWSLERAELTLSIALQHHGIPHVRQFMTGKHAVDFAFPEHGILVEVDGASHTLPGRVERDSIVDRWAVENGWVLHRVSARDVKRNPHQVIESLGLSTSDLRAYGTSGTSK